MTSGVSMSRRPSFSPSRSSGTVTRSPSVETEEEVAVAAAGSIGSKSGSSPAAPAPPAAAATAKAQQTAPASPSTPGAAKPVAPPPPPAATPAQAPPAAGGRGTWDLGRGDRGRALEAAAPLAGVKINGNFSDFDRAVYGPGGVDDPALEVGQTKSVDTTSPGYLRNPRSIYNVLSRKIGEVAGIGQGTWNESGHKVVVGPQTRRVFDVILPPEPLTAAQTAELERLRADSAGIGVEVRTHVVP